ncbi:MAG: class I SAM-dependent methyltransferase, partial [Bacteroidota bacterium]
MLPRRPESRSCPLADNRPLCRIVGENINLPYEDETFDILVSINTLHYSPSEDLRNSLREWRRVLKLG